MGIVLQKLGKRYDGVFNKAYAYYSLLSSINELKLTNKELELIAFTSIKGNISLGNVREKFCKDFDTTTPTINNMVSKLKKKKIFIKKDGVTSVNPLLVLDFSQDIVLQINLSNNGSTVETTDNQENSTKA